MRRRTGSRQGYYTNVPGGLGIQGEMITRPKVLYLIVVIFICGILPGVMAFGQAALLQESGVIMLDAAGLAPAELCDGKPVEGKWWLKKDAQDWGAPNGTILMTGQTGEAKEKSGLHQVMPAAWFVAYRVPEIVVDPKAKGWHKIYAGVLAKGSGKVRPRLLAKLSGEPYPEYIQAPADTEAKTTEVYWKIADLTGKKIHISQPKAPMQHPGFGYLGGLTHLRLVPMSNADVQAAKKEIELPPFVKQLFTLNDIIDEIFWSGTAEDEDDLKAIVYRCKQAGFGQVFWRTYGISLDNSLDVPEAAPRWNAGDEKAWCARQNCSRGWQPYIDMSKKFDQLKVAADYGRKIGCDVHAWVRLTNYNRAPYCNFWYDHPEFSMMILKRGVDPQTGENVPVKPHQLTPDRRVLSFYYPQVRAYYVKFCKQIASTGTRGILIDLLRHPPIAGYEAAEDFKTKFGKDMFGRDLYQDPLVNELFSGYLEAFLIELREAIGNDIIISVRCAGPDIYALKGRKFIDQGLINVIIDGNWYSGNGPRKTIAQTVEAVGSKGKAYAIAEGSTTKEQILALAKYCSGKGVARFGLYESMVFMGDPEMRRTIRQAGWDYNPNP